jgi:hypothetical protein
MRTAPQHAATPKDRAGWIVQALKIGANFISETKGRQDARKYIGTLFSPGEKIMTCLAADEGGFARNGRCR